MKHTYPVGWPFWKAAARLGVRLRVRVNVFRDEAAGVYVGTSPDMRGLIAEAATLEQLLANVKDGAIDLLADQMKRPPARPPVPDLVFDDRFCPA